MAEECAGWVNNAGGRHDCQFDDEPDDHEFDGRSYCRFHLPMGEPGEGGKADWSADQKYSIFNFIVTQIANQKSKVEEEL